MNVASYIFQSPSPSPVQVGRLDPSSTQDSGSSAANMSVPNETLSQAKNFQATQTSEVTPEVTSSEPQQILDVYV